MPNDDYQYGQKSAWKLAREITKLSPYERCYLFGYEEAEYVFRIYEAQEAEEIMSNYDAKKKDMRVIEQTIKGFGKTLTHKQLEDFLNSLEDAD